MKFLRILGLRLLAWWYDRRGIKHNLRRRLGQLTRDRKPVLP